MSHLLQAIGFGLVTASIVALASVAVSLQVSVTNFFNFAFGDFMTLGAYVAWATNSAGLSLVFGILLGGAAVGVLGILVNVLVFRPFMRRGVRPVTLLIAGVGVSFVVQNALILTWTSSPRRFPVNLGNALHIGPFLLTPGDLIMIGTSLVLLLALHLGLTYTKFGKAIRATSNNIALAQSCGIDCDRVISVTWFIAGMFTAIAGVGLVLQESTLNPTTGFAELFVIFGSVILGGIGRPYGAMLGAFIVGIMTEVAGAYVNGAYKTSIAFAVVVILLLFRPQGLIKARGLMN